MIALTINNKNIKLFTMKRLISIFAIFLTLKSFSQVSTIDSLNSFHLDNKPLLKISFSPMYM